uniref:Candidate secreted effector n=1 Tax=Meloidogyne incognita TaxID=6306 RepID=A0A914NLR7_MELIC
MDIFLSISFLVMFNFIIFHFFIIMFSCSMHTANFVIIFSRKYSIFIVLFFSISIYRDVIFSIRLLK